MYRIGLFATGRGQGSRQLVQAIHEAITAGRLKARIEFIFSNREAGEFDPTDGFFQLVRDLGYPLVTHSFRKYRERAGKAGDWRTGYDREVMTLLKPFSPDLCVLAGYLLIWSAEMCERYTAINLHPAAPGGPIGMWQKVIWDLIGTKAETSGNMIFHVTKDLDRGPVVSYGTFSLRGGDIEEAWKAVEGIPVERLIKDPGEELPLFKIIRERGVLRERPLVVETLRAFAKGEVKIDQGTVIDSTGCPTPGLDLTPQIEDYLRHVPHPPLSP